MRTCITYIRMKRFLHASMITQADVHTFCACRCNTIYLGICGCNTIKSCVDLWNDSSINTLIPYANKGIPVPHPRPQPTHASPPPPHSLMT